MQKPDITPSRTIWLQITLICLATLLLRFWQLTHTEVAARDSIGFIRYAWNLGHTNDPVQLLKDSHQHPGYPFIIHLCSIPIQTITDYSLPDAYQLSAQLTSLGFSVALVIPLFLFIQRLLGVQPAFWGTLLFQVLPSMSKVLGDGLSESMFLCLAATSLYSFVKAIQDNNRLCFLTSGIFSGLSYLVRPEGLVIAFAGILVAAWMAFKNKENTNHSIPVRVIPTLLLILGTLATCTPFMLTIGKLTSKPTGQKILETSTIQKGPQPGFAPAGLSLATVPLFSDWWEEKNHSANNKLAWSITAVIQAYTKGFNYLGCIFLLIGIFAQWRGWNNKAELWFILICLTGLNLAYFRVANVVGYLSERHAMLSLLILSGWCASGGILIHQKILELITKPGSTSPNPILNAAPWVLLILLVPSLWKSMETLHYNREGFKQAGHWLAKNSLPGDPVDDPFCWTHYHAGKVFLEGAKNLEHSNPGIRYVVVEKSKNPHIRLQTFSEEKLLKDGGELVFEHKGKNKGAPPCIMVFKIPAPNP